MQITTYTSYAEIRAVLSLSAKEMSDTELGLEIYANALELSLYSVTLPDETPGPGPLPTAFAALDADAANRTLVEQKLYNLTRLYATYVVARVVAKTLSMAAKTISDSKALLGRFASESSYLMIDKHIAQAVGGYKHALENINVVDVVVPDYFFGVAPIVDRVTGE